MDDSSALFSPSSEHALLRESVRAFVAEEVEPQALQHDREERFNLSLFRRLGPLGLLGVTVPEEYGGGGMDAVASVIVHEELSFSDPGFTLSYLAHSLLCVNNIAVNGNPEPCRRHLPRLLSGEQIGAMAMSEPQAGTDVFGMTTRATRTAAGFEISGRKMWITNGCIDDEGTPCDTLVLYARSESPTEGRERLSTFVVERGTVGFSVGQKIRDKCGMRASNTAELCFDSCAVPAANLIGVEGGALDHMMRNLEIERLALAAMSLGIARRSLQSMARYSAERRAFGQQIARFGQIQHHIGESYAELQAARAYVYAVARELRLDRSGQRLDSDGAKLFATQVGKRVADRAMQVLGGYGYVGEYTVERLWRDSKLLEIGGGTLEAHEKNITNDLIRQFGRG